MGTCHLEILKKKYFYIYQQVSVKNEQFFSLKYGEKQDTSNIYHLNKEFKNSLEVSIEEKNQVESIAKLIHYLFSDTRILQQDRDRFFYSESHKKEGGKLIFTINPLSIRNPESIETYFTYNYFDEFNPSRFLKLINNLKVETEEFKKEKSFFLESENLTRLYKFLNNDKFFDITECYENLFTVFNDLIELTKAPFDYKYLSRALSKHLSKEINQSKIQEIKIKFEETFLKDTKYPLFQIYLIGQIKYIRFKVDKLTNYEEIREKLIYLLKFSIEDENISGNHIFFACNEIKKIIVDQLGYSEFSIKDLLKEILEENTHKFKSFLKKTIEPNEKGKYYMLTRFFNFFDDLQMEFINPLFSGFYDFKQFVSSFPNYTDEDYFQEYISFIDQYNSENKSIQYDFKSLFK